MIVFEKLKNKESYEKFDFRFFFQMKVIMDDNNAL